MEFYNNRIKIIGEGSLQIAELFSFKGLNIPFSPFDLPIEAATKDSFKEFGTNYIRVSEVVSGPDISFINLVTCSDPCNELLSKIYKKWSGLVKIENEYDCSDNGDKGEFSINLFGIREE